MSVTRIPACNIPIVPDFSCLDKRGMIYNRANVLVSIEIIQFLHCGESKTQRKWFLDEKRDGLGDENRVINKENKNNRAVLCFIFLLII